MQKFNFSGLFRAAVAMAITVPMLNACASSSSSRQRKFTTQKLPGTSQHRIVRISDSGISSGPENIVNPPRRNPQSIGTSPHQSQ